MKRNPYRRGGFNKDDNAFNFLLVMWSIGFTLTR